MALGTQGYPGNPPLLAAPFTQSPPQSSSDIWPDEPVRVYRSLPLWCLTFSRLTPCSLHLPRKVPGPSALAPKCHPFPRRGIKVAGQPGRPSLIAQKTIQVLRVAPSAMAPESSRNPSPS